MTKGRTRPGRRRSCICGLRGRAKRFFRAFGTLGRARRSRTRSTVRSSFRRLTRRNARARWGSWPRRWIVSVVKAATSSGGSVSSFGASTAYSLPSRIALSRCKGVWRGTSRRRLTRKSGASVSRRTELGSRAASPTVEPRGSRSEARPKPRSRRSSWGSYSKLRTPTRRGVCGRLRGK